MTIDAGRLREHLRDSYEMMDTGDATEAIGLALRQVRDAIVRTLGDSTV